MENKNISISYNYEQAAETKTIVYCPKCANAVTWHETTILGYRPGDSGLETILQFTCKLCSHSQKLVWHGIVMAETDENYENKKGNGEK